MNRRLRKTLEERFWEKVEKRGEEDCWEWTGSRNILWQYGQFHFGGHCGKTLKAHRVSWEIHNGKIPPGLLVCHKCDNRVCVNPSHLYLGTHSDNLRDAWERTRVRKHKAKEVEYADQ